jgi:hypothetical protein
VPICLGGEDEHRRHAEHVVRRQDPALLQTLQLPEYRDWPGAPEITGRARPRRRAPCAVRTSSAGSRPGLPPT